jgi:hypothetical protein
VHPLLALTATPAALTAPAAPAKPIRAFGEFMGGLVIANLLMVVLVFAPAVAIVEGKRRTAIGLAKKHRGLTIDAGAADAAGGGGAGEGEGRARKQPELYATRDGRAVSQAQPAPSAQAAEQRAAEDAMAASEVMAAALPAGPDRLGRALSSRGGEAQLAAAGGGAPGAAGGTAGADSDSAAGAAQADAQAQPKEASCWGGKGGGWCALDHDGVDLLIARYHNALYEWRWAVMGVFLALVAMGALTAQQLAPSKQLLALLPEGSNAEMVKYLRKVRARA